MPTPTDLVTDLPADFEVFGQAVDTSMADLKGGTSGQILAKNSNTDMDFVWIANDQGDITGITASSPLTGGGTSGAVTIGILNGTTSNLGAVQLSDSTSSTSTTLAATANAVKQAYDLAAANTVPTSLGFAAGKNKIINGDFGIWQRGTSVTLTNNTTAYTTDRWYIYTSFSAGSSTVARQTFTPGTAPVAGYEGEYFARYTAGSTVTYVEFGQRIEGVQTFAGQTATLSFWAKASANTTLSGTLVQNFGSGGSSAVSTGAGSHSITTSWQRFTATVSVPSISGKTIGAGNYLNAVFASSSLTGSQTIDFWGVQLEAGSVATAFQTATGTIQGELAACQRYYWRNTGGSTYTTYSIGNNYSTTGAVFTVQFPVPMRIEPATIEYANLGINEAGVGNWAVTLLSIQSPESGPMTARLQADVASGLTAQRPSFLANFNNVNGYVGLSAEL